LTYTYNF